jgi:hypothetical protein
MVSRGCGWCAGMCWCDGVMGLMVGGIGGYSGVYGGWWY